MNKSAGLLAIIMIIILPASGQTHSYGIVTDIDGNRYKTVVIGDLEWMAENLRTTSFSNGEKIPYCISDTVWSGSEGSAYCWYSNDSYNERIYGALYNWYSVDKKLLCPVGWRVPSDSDWSRLSGFADTKFKMDSRVWGSAGLSGFDAGRRIKARSGWAKEGNGTDDFSFSALPGGERSGKDGHFHLAGYNGYWWSSTEEGKSDSWYRSIIYSLDNISRDTHNKACGFSVRCIRDTASVK